MSFAGAQSPPAARAWTIWITGLPASGKSSLARRLVHAMRERALPAVWLDSDDLRRVLTPEPTYSDREREHFYGVLAHLARLGVEGGAHVVVSATAPLRQHRRRARDAVPHFIEVYLRCDPRTLERRDQKGLYEAARRGRISRLPGAGAPYEPPEQAEIVIDTAELDADQALGAVLAALPRFGLPPVEG